MNDQYLNYIKQEISTRLCSRAVMRLAYKYFNGWMQYEDQALRARKGSKKRAELERKATAYKMHYFRLFVTYRYNDGTYDRMSTTDYFTRMNLYRDEIGLPVIKFDELTHHEYRLPEFI